MKRVLWLEGSGNSASKKLNEWLANHTGVELVDIRPVVTEPYKIRIFCIVNIPDSVDTSGWSEDILEYLGMKDKRNQEDPV